MLIDPETKKSIKEHIRKHTDYPATKRDLIRACNNMSDFTREQKEWFKKTLPAGTYERPSEVIKAIGF